MSRWKRWAGAFARKARSVLVLSLIGGVITAIGGSLFTIAAVLIDFGGPMSREIPALLAGVVGDLAGMFFMLGAITVGTFATLLSATGRRHTLIELSVPRTALMGGLIGLLLPIVLVTIAAGPPVSIAMILEGWPVWSSLGIGGGVLSGGLVAIAKRAEHRELRAIEQIQP